jgi:hypothetical protein
MRILENIILKKQQVIDEIICCFLFLKLKKKYKNRREFLMNLASFMLPSSMAPKPNFWLIFNVGF